MAVENLLHLTLKLVPRFPNSVPSGIYVPYWATLDVTVCFKVLFYGNVFTVYFRMRMSGTLTQRFKQVVSIMFPIISFSLLYDLTDV